MPPFFLGPAFNQVLLPFLLQHPTLAYAKYSTVISVTLVPFLVGNNNSNVVNI